MSELNPCEAIEILESIYPSKKQIVTGEYPEVAEALDMAIAALCRAQPTNDPLTLEQLREMDGEPVYIKYHTCGRWEIYQSFMHDHGLHGKTWFAYLRPPERSENE